MKAISVQQPWASLIVHGIKDIENRTWQTKFRGKVYIHATAKESGALYELLNDKQIEKMNNHWTDSPYPNRPLSAIIGEVDIVDCVINHPSIWAEKTPYREEDDFMDEKDERNYYKNILPNIKPIYNWVLANPVLYEKPILNVKGALSFWEPEDCLQECIACGEHLKLDDTVCDDGGEYYHQECYDEMLPTLLKDAEENPID